MNAVAAEATTARVGHFLVNGDSTVTDTSTGLMWTQGDVTEKPVKHEAAMQACVECRVGGFDDWRAPTVEELFLLADRTREYPAIDKEAFPSCDGGWYWSSTLDCSDPSGFACFVGFNLGISSYDFRGSNNRVRAVRVAASQFSASLASGSEQA